MEHTLFIRISIVLDVFPRTVHVLLVSPTHAVWELKNRWIFFKELSGASTVGYQAHHIEVSKFTDPRFFWNLLEARLLLLIQESNRLPDTALVFVSADHVLHHKKSQ